MGAGAGGGGADVHRWSCMQQVNLSADSYCTAGTIVRGSSASVLKMNNL